MDNQNYMIRKMKTFLVIIINRIKYVSALLKKLFKKGIRTNINKYDSYEAYLKHQKVKTTDQIRIHKPNKIIFFFKTCKVIDSKSIKNLHDQMHWEIILKKII